MALNDLFGMIDNGLRAAFERETPDPVRLRRPLLKGVDRTLAQLRSGKPAPRGGWWMTRNGVVALTVKVNGDTFDINGVATNHMPLDRFEEFLDKMREAVEAGAFDKELANKGNGDATVHISKRQAAAKGPRSGWTPERRARYQATMAAKRGG